MKHFILGAEALAMLVACTGDSTSESRQSASGAPAARQPGNLNGPSLTPRGNLAAATSGPPYGCLNTTNLALNRSFETGPGPSPSAAASWYMHSDYNGAAVSSDLVTTSVPGPGIRGGSAPETLIEQSLRRRLDQAIVSRQEAAQEGKVADRILGRVVRRLRIQDVLRRMGRKVLLELGPGPREDPVPGILAGRVAIPRAPEDVAGKGEEGDVSTGRREVGVEVEFRILAPDEESVLGGGVGAGATAGRRSSGAFTSPSRRFTVTRR